MALIQKIYQIPVRFDNIFYVLIILPLILS